MILLVEDDEQVLALCSRILQNDGFDVVACKNPMEAMQAILKLKPTLLITDLSLPMLSGFELLAVLRTTEGLEQLPAIAITGYTQLESFVSSHGFQACLEKPFDPQQLTSLARRMLPPRG